MNEQTSKPQKKELPYSCTKSELYTMYLNQMSYLSIQNAINTILKHSQIRISVKRIPHVQFMEFVETYGLPKGYFLTDND